MKYTLLYLHFFIVLLSLSGCGRIIDWGKRTIDQGSSVQQFTDITKQYLRSHHIYTQLETAAIFDVLWLSDEVRTAYVDTYAQRFGMNAAQREKLLSAQLAQNQRTISFYVLSLYDVYLAAPTAQWAISLKIGDAQYMPLRVQPVELDPEYKLFFGKLLTRFKVAYMVECAAYDAAGNPLITPDVSTIELVFRSLTKESVMQWHIDARARVKRKVTIKRDNPSSGHLFDVYEELEVEAE